MARRKDAQNPGEDDPLLPPTEFTSAPVADDPAHSDIAVPVELVDNRTTAQRLRIAVPCMLTLFCLVIGDLLTVVPVNAIREDLICRKMFPDITTAAESSSDPRCKDAAVQAELAYIAGWEITFVIIPSILTGVPWGIAADKYGRTFVLQLANVGVFCSFFWQIFVYKFNDVIPLRWVWLQGVFFFLGGGASTYAALLYTVVSDISSEAQRSTALLYMGAASKAAALLGGPVVYLSMQRSAWFAVYLGLALWVLLFFLTASIPETRSEAAIKRANQDGNGSDLSLSSLLNVKELVSGIIMQTKTLFDIMLIKNPVLGILLFSTLFTTIGSSADTILLQYATKRFEWTWAEGSFISSVKGFVSLGLTGAILPAISQIMISKFKLPPLVKDWYLVLASIFAMFIGNASIALSDSRPLFIASLVVCELGGGFEFAFHGMTSELVDPAHIARLYTTIGVFLLSSGLFAGPLLAVMYRKGLELGGRWLALPFLVSAILFFIALVINVSVRLNRHPKARAHAA